MISFQDHSEKIEFLQKENNKLKEQLKAEKQNSKQKLEECEKETEDMLKKYQKSVLSMHGKLKQLADKFEEGEKTKNHKLRKARK